MKQTNEPGAGVTSAPMGALGQGMMGPLGGWLLGTDPPARGSQGPMGSIRSAETTTGGFVQNSHANLYFKVNKTKILNILGLLHFTQIT